MKLIIAIVIIISVHCYVNSEEKVVCNKEGENNIDLNISKMYLFGSPDRSYPTSDEQMKTFCRDNNRLQNEIKTYSNKCLVKLSKQLMNLLMYSIVKHNNNMCKSQKRKREFLQFGNCGNAAKADTVKCWNNLTLSLDGVRSKSSDKIKIPMLCCHYFAFKACALKAYEKQPKQCNRKSVEGLDNLMNVYAIDVLRFMCGDYNDENDKCDSIIEQTPKSNLTTLPYSPFSVAIKIIEGFPEL